MFYDGMENVAQVHVGSSLCSDVWMCFCRDVEDRRVWRGGNSRVPVHRKICRCLHIFSLWSLDKRTFLFNDLNPDQRTFPLTSHLFVIQDMNQRNDTMTWSTRRFWLLSAWKRCRNSLNFMVSDCFRLYFQLFAHFKLCFDSRCWTEQEELNVPLIVGAVPP